MVVAITGGIGSGKSSVVKEFQKFANVATYIADVEAKRIMTTSPVVREKLINAFGPQSFSDGHLNRQFLADLVFNDPKKLAQINSIVHPEVFKDLRVFVSQHKDKLVLYESALVFETGSAELFDVVILVSAPEKVRIQRVVQRDGASEKQVLERIHKQWSEERKKLQSHYLISNIDFKDTIVKINKIHNILTEKP
ncbi:MAG: dephospho-CoA kinase [Flavobacteriaceae bacterium]|nr:dephospho-CoA kinase [Flavobacteriaceae bacterium]|tara:strand:+ start:13136 stop:13720 length:585 start_codon:yes stop_codon:yes gene_type:complete